MDCGLEESARRMAKWGDPLGFLAANHYLHLPIIAEKSTMKTHTTLLFCALSFWGVAQSTDFINVAPALGLQDSIGVFAYSGGVSFADFDGDGYDDLTVATGEGLPVLFYRNDGVGGFEQLPALVDNTGEVKMALWADYDNDGDRDLLLTCTASPNRLYRNEGDLVLVDVTEAAGLPLTDDLSWGAQAKAIWRLEDEGDTGFAYGNAADATAWLALRLCDWASISGRLAYHYEQDIAGHYDGPHAHVAPPHFQPNYGGHTLDGGIGLNLKVANGPLKGHRLAIEGLLPMYQDLNGVGMERNFTLVAGWQFAF